MRCLTLLVLVLGLGCSEPAPAAKTTRTGKAFAERLQDRPGLTHVAQLGPGVYRGAQPSAEGFKALKEMGVKTVICFRSHHSTKAAVEDLGMTSVEMPLQADIVGSTPPSEKQVEDFFRTVLDPVRQPVYFHCAHGKDRTGTMAALYRIEVDGWTPEEAVEEMQAFGYHDNYKDLINFVRSYKPRGFAGKK
ncbi:MAG TPA: tyrosine-protein phosphatase [Planctomycetota bacterium]|nr:tyrosine-protein phosphatase [Planctomycetota bacterium]